MIADHLSTAELSTHNITSLSEAIETIAFTKDENGLYFYDAGHAEPWEACEGTVRQELQTMARYQPELPADGNEKETRYHHEIRVAAQAYNFILEDILARPGYVPLADRPTPQWKIDFRNRQVESLEEALGELELGEMEDGSFFYDGDSELEEIIIDEAYCKRQLERFKENPLESDEGIDFYPFHNIRLWVQAYELVIAEIQKRTK